MKRLLVSIVTVIVAGCSPTMGLGDPPRTDVPTVVLRADANAGAASVGAAIREASPRFALVVGPGDVAWFTEMAATSGLDAMTRPGVVSAEMGLAFLGQEAVGDTLMTIAYEGGTFPLHDALFDLGQRRFLDLLSFRVDNAAAARPMITALTEYIATDVMAGAAVIMAVAVPDAAVGDSVARMLSPMYQGAVHCNAPAESAARSGVRLFYGPAARIYCTSVAVEQIAVGDRIRAQLVVGRPR
jgi:hypothetical protein